LLFKLISKIDCIKYIKEKMSGPPKSFKLSSNFSQIISDRKGESIHIRLFSIIIYKGTGIIKKVKIFIEAELSFKTEEACNLIFI